MIAQIFFILQIGLLICLICLICVNQFHIEVGNDGAGVMGMTPLRQVIV